MKLTNAHMAIVERVKIQDYLLNATHPDNVGKAAFFAGLGFDPDNWQVLAAAPRNVAQNHLVKMSVASPHGQKYVLEGRVETPNGKVAWIPNDLDR